MSRIGREPSYNQEALWAQHAQVRDSWCLHNVIGIKIDGPYSKEMIDHVKSSFDKIVDRHETLSSYFFQVDGKILYDHRDIKESYFKILSADNLDEEQARRLLITETRKTLDLEHDSLFQVRFLKNGAHQSYIAFWAHHIVTDGYSLEILQKEFKSFFLETQTDKPSSLPEVRGKYDDYCKKERAIESEASFAESLKFLNSHLESKLPPTKIFEANARSSYSYEEGRVSLRLERDLSEALLNASLEKNVTSYAFLLTIFMATIRQFTEQKKLAVGIFSLNRASYGARNVVGYYSNPLVFQKQFDENLSLNQLVREIMDEMLALIENEKVPFPLLVEKLQPLREPGANPFFRIVFDSLLFGTDLYKDFVSDGAKFSRFSLEQGGATFDLLIFLLKNDGHLEFEALFNKEIYHHDQISQLMHAFKTACREFVQTPEMSFRDLQVIPSDEFKKVIYEWNETETKVDQDLQARISHFAERTPHQIAVRCDGQSLTYADLSERINKFQKALYKISIHPGDKVVFNLNKSINLVPLIFAVWRCGAIYVPLDPDYPEERISAVLRSVRPELLIVEQKIEAYVDLARKTINIKELDDVDLGHFSESLVHEQNSTAYIIYTSGSTGVPKGVVISHEALNNLVMAFEKIVNVTSADRMLCSCSISFDISILELFLPLYCGGTMVLAHSAILANGPELLNMIKKEKISIGSATPMSWEILFRSFAESEKVLRAAVCGGDSFDLSLVEKIKKMSYEVYNVYGPTETCVWSTTARVDKFSGRKLTIGKPIAKTQIYILNENQKPVPVGIAGEIYIGGIGVSSGYFNDLTQTDEKFVKNPFINNQKMYRTGDWGYFDTSGEIIFIGRKDNQIKLRGYRIELGDIETKTRLIEGIRDVVVCLVGDQQSERKLVAFYIKADSSKTLSNSDFVSHLREQLPEYMIPSDFFEVDKFPYSIRNKIDRKELAKVYLSRSIPNMNVKESNGSEEEILRMIWQNVLNTEVLDLDGNFFDLGGSSVLIHKVKLEIQNRMNIEVEILDLFVNTSINKLSEFLKKKQRAYVTE